MHSKGRKALARCELKKLFDLHALEASGLLKAVPDSELGALGDGCVGDVLAVEDDGAGRRLLDAHDELRQRGFAAAVRTGYDRESTVFDRKGKVVDDALRLRDSPFNRHLEYQIL